MLSLPKWGQGLSLEPAMKPRIKAFSGRVTLFAVLNISWASNICSFVKVKCLRTCWPGCCWTWTACGCCWWGCCCCCWIYKEKEMFCILYVNFKTESFSSYVLSCNHRIWCLNSSNNSGARCQIASQDGNRGRLAISYLWNPIRGYGLRR